MEVTTIAELASLLVDLFNDLCDAADIAAINDRLLEIQTQISNIFNFLFTFDTLETYFDKKIDALVSEISFVKQCFLQFVGVDGDVKNIFEAFSGVNQNLTFLKQSLGESDKYISDMLDNIYYELNHLVTNILDYSYDTSFYAQQIRVTLEYLYNDFSNDLDTINSSVSTLINMLSTLLSNVLTGIYSAYKSDLATISSELDRLNDISDKISDLYDKLCDVFDEILALSETTTIVKNNINIDNKINFVKQLVHLATAFFADFDTDAELQSYDFNFNLFGSDISFSLDLSFLPSETVTFVRAFTSAIFIFKFLQYLLKRIPEIVFRG